MNKPLGETLIPKNNTESYDNAIHGPEKWRGQSTSPVILLSSTHKCFMQSRVVGYERINSCSLVCSGKSCHGSVMNKAQITCSSIQPLTVLRQS